ncbi:MAG: hypothetical protein D6679_13740 [Candidatus Hydrogenedentota bacterium]|nr:MAG: hypothetical protein D6679_13740 [Candidatus Hydrogenedentota bacterium]
MKGIGTRRMGAAIFGVGLILAAGCTLPEKQADEGSGLAVEEEGVVEELQPAAALRIPDLPVPAGFTYDAAKSMILEYGDVLAGTVYFQGPAEVGAVIEFFRKEMPNYDWQLVSMIEREKVRMVFDKPGKIAQVTISPRQGFAKGSGIFVYYAPKTESN